MPTEEVIREGKKVEEIVKQIDEDEDVAVLVLGASKEAAGPGPLVSALAAGAMAGKFPIPITIVPGRPGRRGHQGAGLSAERRLRQSGILTRAAPSTRMIPN